MNSPVDQLSAVAAMLQCSSNKQGIICEINRLVAIPPSVAYSKENSGSYWTSTTELNVRYKELQLIISRIADLRFFFFGTSFLKITLLILSSYLSNLSFAFRPLSSKQY